MRRRASPAALVQDNLSRSTRGVLRGLHLQNPHPQGKLVDRAARSRARRRGRCAVGQPDLRPARQDGAQRRQPAAALGSARLRARLRGRSRRSAEFFYKCDELYSPADELVLRFDDPELGIDWGIGAPIVSERDRNGKSAVGAKARLPVYAGRSMMTMSELRSGRG